jgi:hypothetical protein|tara:strand:- start:1061 stop:1801 length:741 start_codon:yes stop_codon:yes gene_type:complete
MKFTAKMKKPKISLFVPVYNEERILYKHIKRILSNIKKITDNFEIIIVDDNSSDNSSDICKKISRKIKKVCYLRYNIGPSRRENLAKSFKKARGDIIVLMDIDLSVDPMYTWGLFKEIKNGADICIGSRHIKGSYIKKTIARRIISYFYNLFMKFYFNSRIHDHQCGFKAFKKNVVLDLVKDMGYDKKFVRGWFWDAELLMRAQKKSYKVVEFPVRWVHGQKSEFELKRELRMIPYVLRLRKKLAS